MNVTSKEIIKEGETLSNHTDLSTYIHDYYSNLYRRGNCTKHSSQALDARASVMQAIPLVVSLKQNTTLTNPFSTLELGEAVLELQRGKASRPDGVPIEFFKELWEFVVPDVLNLINYILKR